MAKPLDFVIWYRNGTEVLNYHHPSNRREKIETRLMFADNVSVSQLTIRNVDYSDTGNYTCTAQNTEPAQVQVYVSEGSHISPCVKFEMDLCRTWLEGFSHLFLSR